MKEQKIKDSVASEETRKRKQKAELDNDIKGYFAERDKTNRGNNGIMDDLQNKAAAEAEVKDLLYKASMKEVELPEGCEPMFNSIFLTARRNKVRTASGLLIASTLTDEGLEVEFQDQQKVMAAGPQVQQALRGCEVVIDFNSLREYTAENMADKVNKKTHIKVPLIDINGTEYIRITERNLKYIVSKPTEE